MHSFGLRLDPSKNYRYSYSANAYGSPSRVSLKSFDTVIGTTVNEALEFAASEMSKRIDSFGIPNQKAFYYTERLDKFNEKNRMQLIERFLATLDWDQGRFDD